ncbi:hypothetical protein O181_050776 [Austropuccinia psidii MF-1]|uniref:Uncharacterized protein n=1 Tax=Austropuccinia psidii MF-1 TaxID=1389203 RepID=A0A9Q3HMP2_9BASI|nr:hypothetical protein [Austropuccinia psidii MF-1]
MKKPQDFQPQLDQVPTSLPEIGSEIYDMDSSNELGFELKGLALYNNQEAPVLPKSFIVAQPPRSEGHNLKIYEEENTFELCAPTEDFKKIR